MQVNKIETTKKLKMLDLQMDVVKTSKKKYAITSMEVQELTPDARCVFFHKPTDVSGSGRLLYGFIF